MAVAIRERWFADDFEFTDGDVMDVEYRSGQLGSPAVRGANAKVANRPGEVWRPKVIDVGTFTLEVWLGSYQRQAQQLWDQLLRAVIQPHRQITWQRVTADGESRYCEGEVVGAMQPTAIGQAAYRASVAVNVPGGLWRGDQLVTVTKKLTAGATSAAIDLAAFSTSTAPLTDLALDLAGQLVNPTLTDTTPRGRGDTLLYAGTIPDKAGLALDCGDWSATPRGSGWTYNGQALNYSGDRFLELAATPPGITHSLRLDATTIGTAGQVTVSGYKSYLC